MHRISPAHPVVSTRLTRPIFVLCAIIATIGSILLLLTGYTQPLIMGVVQGLGEFLPISSTAHLLLVPWLFGWDNALIESLTFDVALHIGTLIALLIYFWRDWLALLRGFPGLLLWALRSVQGAPRAPLSHAQYLLAGIVIGTIPATLAGILVEDVLDQWVQESSAVPLLIATTLSCVGILLYVVDRWWPERLSLEQVSWRTAFLIGIAQACSIMPGVSRSGSTMLMGRWLELDRTTAARFSFLLSAPITVAAVAVKFDNLLEIPASEISTVIAGVLVSAFVGGLAIHFLLDYIRRIGFGVFAVYRILLAIAIVLIYFLRN